MLPGLAGVEIDWVESSGGEIRIGAHARDQLVGCVRCGVLSSRVHGRYRRRVADRAVSGIRMVLELTVRRMRCVNADCPSVTFVEQILGLTREYGRYTVALESTLAAIGLALAGRAGSRLAAVLGIQAGRDTLLRRVRALPEGEPGVITVLGVDDFAFRRGHRYGTVMVDLLTNRPVDLIDGRDGNALASWLKSRPGTEFICRDRAGGYGEGARLGAPQARQVADRFHLWQNLGQAVEKTVNTLRASLAEPVKADAAKDDSAPPMVQPPSQKRIVLRLQRNYEAVQDLHRQGLNKTAIGRKLGLHPATVRKFALARQAEDLTAKTEQRASIIDGYAEYLHQRWNEGERNATGLFREIAARGYSGGELAVQRYLRQFRKGRGHAPRTGPRPPSVREVTSWIMTDPEKLKPDNTIALKRILKRDKEMRRLTNHVKAFAIMMTQRQGQDLTNWIAAAEADTLPSLASFARNLRRDFDAVRNGLTLPYSSGPVEGNINRIKMLKRQMFGRANLDLLRKRVILAR